MSAPTATAETEPATTPPDSTIPDGLEITGWVRTSDPDLELAFDRTVGQVKKSFRDLYLANRECRECGEDYEWPPAIFAGKDGRMYAADLDVVIRLASPDEVREAIADELEEVNNYASARIKTLQGFLNPPTA